MTEKIPSLLFAAFINLDRSIERRKNIEVRLSRTGISAQRFRATDGKEFSFNLADLDNSLSMGERGCAHSHRSVWENFLNNSDSPFALIMEDDIEFDANFSQVIEEVLAQVEYKKNVYVQFDYAPVGIKGVILWWFLFSNRFRNQKHLRSFWVTLPFLTLKGLAANLLSLYEGARNAYWQQRKRVRVVKTHKDRYLAGCYLVSRATASELINLNTPLRYAADAVHNIARRHHLVNHYICVPRSTRQKREEFTSTLDNTHFGKKVIAY